MEHQVCSRGHRATDGSSDRIQDESGRGSLRDIRSKIPDVDVDLSVLDFVRQPKNCEPRVIPWTHYLSAEGYLITEDGSNE